MGNFGKALKRGMKAFAGPMGPGAYEAGGKRVVCPHCGAAEFAESRAQLNTAGMTFVGLDWAIHRQRRWGARIVAVCNGSSSVRREYDRQAQGQVTRSCRGPRQRDRGKGTLDDEEVTMATNMKLEPTG